MLARLRQQGRNVRQIVLAVGIHLQGMAETELMGAAQPRHHGAALALVVGVAQQGNPGVLGGQRIQCGGGHGLAAIVDQQAGQLVLGEPCQHGGQRAGVVVTGDENAGHHGIRRTRPLLAGSSPSM
ncbi:hypothetical protein D3C78_1310670 [compost metagenome]